MTQGHRGKRQGGRWMTMSGGRRQQQGHAGYCGFCRKNKAKQRKQSMIGSFESFLRSSALRVVPGPGKTRAEEYHPLGCEGQREKVWLGLVSLHVGGMLGCLPSLRIGQPGRDRKKGLFVFF